jgi:hypothetical protein
MRSTDYTPHEAKIPFSGTSAYHNDGRNGLSGVPGTKLIRFSSFICGKNLV